MHGLIHICIVQAGNPDLYWKFKRELRLHFDKSILICSLGGGGEVYAGIKFQLSIVSNKGDDFDSSILHQN